MALKRDRDILQSDISWFMNEVATRGGVAAVSLGGSGVALDNQGSPTSPRPLVTYSASPSGARPIGILLNDVVSVDTTRFHVNFHKDEVAKPGKVTLMKKGWVLTNNIVGNPTPGAEAFLIGSGNVTATFNTIGGLAASPRIGIFASSKDENGYAKLEVNLPF